MIKAIASANGLAAVERAFALLRGGASALDACVEAVTLVEDDPAEMTVGYGGLPNEDGVVELDAAVMDGRTHRGGAVAALQSIRHPTKVARLVMQRTDRVLLVGQGALRFALANGFERENLLTDEARQRWLQWKRSRSACDEARPSAPKGRGPDVPPGPAERPGGSADSQAAQRPGGGSPPDPTGTVHCAVIDAGGGMACATSTSGHAFKIAGRVGDSPILGAGLYVDNDVGSCGSTGNGEANLEHLSSFAAVELMRAGRSAREAGLEVLRRIARKARPEQRDEHGRPRFHVQLFLLASDGRHAGAAMWSGKQMAVADPGGARLERCTTLFHS